MSRRRVNNSPARRYRRYADAVRRQIAMVDAWDRAGRLERIGMHLPAPVEDFLRRGDRVEDFYAEPGPDAARWTPEVAGA